MAGPYYYATIVCVTTKRTARMPTPPRIADLAGGTVHRPVRHHLV